jgi:hypothetical protein
MKFLSGSQFLPAWEIERRVISYHIHRGNDITLYSRGGIIHNVRILPTIQSQLYFSYHLIHYFNLGQNERKRRNFIFFIAPDKFRMFTFHFMIHY